MEHQFVDRAQHNHVRRVDQVQIDDRALLLIDGLHEADILYHQFICQEWANDARQSELKNDNKEAAGFACEQADHQRHHHVQQLLVEGAGCHDHIVVVLDAHLLELDQL